MDELYIYVCVCVCFPISFAKRIQHDEYNFPVICKGSLVVPYFKHFALIRLMNSRISNDFRPRKAKDSVPKETVLTLCDLILF